MGQELDLGLQNSFLIFLVLEGKERRGVGWQPSSHLSHEASADVSLGWGPSAVILLYGCIVSQMQ